VTGVALGIAAITAVAVWSGAARHVVSTPSAYGITWDATISPTDASQFTFDPSVLDAAAGKLAAAPQVGTTIARVVAGMYEGSPGEVEIIEIDRARDRWWPTVISGRAPAADDEITIGFGVPGLDLGDTVQVGGRTLRVVGRHVVAPLSNGSPGSSVAISTGAARDLQLTSPNVLVLVRLARGASVDDLRRLTGDGVGVYGPACLAGCLRGAQRGGVHQRADRCHPVPPSRLCDASCVGSRAAHDPRIRRLARRARHPDRTRSRSPRRTPGRSHGVAPHSERDQRHP
jgi:hypothetical protein